MPDSPFFAFPSTDKARWQQQATKELRGKDFDETLRWNTEAGFLLDPYYTADELADVPLAAIQAAQKQTPGWESRAWVSAENPVVANRLAREALANGADALGFSNVTTTTDFPRILHGIRLSDTPAAFWPDPDLPADALLRQLRAATGYPPKGSLWQGLYLSPDGTDRPAFFATAAETLRLSADAPAFRTLALGLPPYPTVGTVEGLVSLLRQTVEVLDALTDAGFSSEEIFRRLEVQFNARPDYLTTLAHLRALRFLLAELQRAYGLTEPVPVFIHAWAEPALTLYAEPEAEDLARATLKAMSVVAAGCDALSVHVPDFDGSGAAPRLARNISNLLRDEAYFARVADPAAGSYFLEKLTWELAREAWEEFLK